MEIKELLNKGRDIWGDEKLNLNEIIVRLGKVFGDICRWERNYKRDEVFHNEDELKKELGNIIFSTIRWCDDLGYNPEECINLAIKAQKKLSRELKEE